VLTGHVPVLVDVEPDTYQVDIDKHRAQHHAAHQGAMLIPSLVGGMPDWDRLRAMADKHGLKIIEDSCDTLGGTYRGTPAGKRSDISVTSFSIFHIITCLGNGGLVAVDDPNVLWDRALMLRAWGRSSEKFMHGTRKATATAASWRTSAISNTTALFIFEEIAYGFIPNEAGAAFGHEQLNKLDLFTTTAPGALRPAHAIPGQAQCRYVHQAARASGRGVHDLDLLPDPCCARNSAGAVASCRCTWKTNGGLHPRDHSPAHARCSR
jgi:dTDP-4-amino-4,6-dideoxygalactose transaminase